MAYQRILAVLDGSKEGEAALRSALVLARAAKANVTALHVFMDGTQSLPLLAEGMTPAMLSDLSASLEAEAKRAAASAEAQFKKLCSDAGIPSGETPGSFTATWRKEKGIESDFVTRLGRLFDLIVLPHPTSGEEGVSSPTLEAALFDSGRPVLLPGKGLDALPAHVAVAWNGSREASHAVSFALPLLASAKTVTILTGQDKKDGAKASDLAAHLASHGVMAKTWTFTPDDTPVAGSLIAEAKKAGANLLVMGAYGHSRLRELVLGGATRAALKQSDLPLLLAH